MSDSTKTVRTVDLYQYIKYSEFANLDLPLISIHLDTGGIITPKTSHQWDTVSHMVPQPSPIAGGTTK